MLKARVLALAGLAVLFAWLAAACGTAGDTAMREDVGGTAPRAPAASGPPPPPTSSPPPSSTAIPADLRYDLRRDERRGGHTLDRHVGKTDAELRARLRRERITAASTYPDETTAAWVVAATLTESADTVRSWTRRRGNRPNLALRYAGSGGRVIGRSLIRGRPAPVDCEDALVVLRWDEEAGEYYVLTSYPEARR